MRDLRIRCSSIGKIMTEPKTLKEGPLSVGAKTHIRELAAQDIFGVDFEISDKRLEKGKLVEDEAIALVSRVRGLSLTKNTERRTNEWITGEADVFDPLHSRGHDVKSAWSVQTFPICPEDVAGTQRALYEWQMVGYCWLWDADEWSIDYCLLDTPENLIGFEPLQLHVVSHIPERLRVTSWTVRRDSAKEKAIAEKVRHARLYYAEVIAEFERTHVERPATVPPWVTADASEPASPANETTLAAADRVLAPTF